MNKIVLTLILVVGLALCLPAYAERNAGGKQKRGGAQPGMGMGQGPGMRGGQMFADLGLTDDQKQKLQPIMREYRTGMADVMKSSATPEEKAAKIKKLRKEAMSGVKAILTGEQYKKAQKAGIFDRMFGAPGMKIMRVFQQLDLTEKQKSEIKEITKAQMEKTKAIREDKSLTREQKMEKIKPLRKATEEKIMNLLTSEQKAKLKELMKKQPGMQGEAGTKREAGTKKRAGKL
jgi:Spy/CpxP family protein refolding chaperone